MSKLLAAAAAVSFVLAAPVARAATFVYDFAMPEFGPYVLSTLDGRASLLRLWLDNGGSSNLGQTYGLQDIVSAKVRAVDGTGLSTPMLPVLQAASSNPAFITTDGTGAATLDTSSSIDESVLFSAGSLISPTIVLATAGINPTGGPCTYAASFETGDRGTICLESEVFTARGWYIRTELSEVPLPAGGLLLLTALGGLAVTRGRRLA